MNLFKVILMCIDYTEVRPICTEAWTECSLINEFIPDL